MGGGSTKVAIKRTKSERVRDKTSEKPIFR